MIFFAGQKIFLVKNPRRSYFVSTAGFGANNVLRRFDFMKNATILFEKADNLTISVPIGNGGVEVKVSFLGGINLSACDKAILCEAVQKLPKISPATLFQIACCQRHRCWSGEQLKPRVCQGTSKFYFRC